MKTSSYGLLAVLLVASVATVAAGRKAARLQLPAGAKKTAAEREIKAKLAELPLTFEQNQGQAAGKVKFISRGHRYGLFLSPRGAVMTLAHTEDGDQPTKGQRRKTKSAILAMRLNGANPNPNLRGVGQQAGKTNYLIGTDRAKWHTDVANYARVQYDAVYPGVDMVYYGNQRKLEYDFVVAPHADPSKIELAFAGARSMQVDQHGDLVLNLNGGSVRQHKPVVYQKDGAKLVKVAGNYTLRGKNVVGFELGAYDRSKTLIIDPVLRYSTYIGGSDGDYAAGIALDPSGNAYVTGYTISFDQGAVTKGTQTMGQVDPPVNGPALSAYPTVNAFMGDPDRYFFTSPTGIAPYDYQSYEDAFITKLNSSGSGLVYSTYFGGGGNDRGNAITVNAAGEAYITGSTTTPFFPFFQGIPLLNPVQSRNAGGTDAFVMKLNASGNFPVFSTYLGGSGTDVGRAITLDPRGNVLVAGSTDSTDFNTYNAQQPTNHGSTDAFVTSLNASGSGFNYSTYLGGANSDNAYGIATDSDGNVYVVGDTSSTDFPTTPLAFQQNLAGLSDAFVTVLDLSGANRLFSTFLGGTGNDGARALALDSARNIYLTGFTTSPDFPIANAYQPALGGSSDAFVTKFNSGITQLIFSTYLGGSGSEQGNSIAVSAGNQAYVTGTTSSNNFPIFNHVQAGRLGTTDAFVTKFTRPGTALEYSTYLGGPDLIDGRGQRGAYNPGSRGAGIVVDGTGTAFVTGQTSSADFPHTLGAYQTNLARPSGGAHDGIPDEPPYVHDEYGPYDRVDVFVTRLGSPPLAPSNLGVTFVSTTEIDLSWVDNSDNEQTFEVERNPDANGNAVFGLIGAVGAGTVTFANTGLIPTTTYSYRVRAVNQDGTSAYSNTVTTSTLPAPPKAPSGLKVSVLDRTRLKLDFTDNSNNEAVFYVERSLDGTNFTRLSTSIPAVAGSGGAVTFTDTGLTPNTKYYYRVVSSNVAGDSAPSNVDSGTTLPNPPTVAPVLTATTISNSEIDLSWTYAPTDAVGFKIFRSTDGNVFSLYRQTSTTATTFQDTGLPSKTKYYYQVEAYNQSGDGPLSNTVNATTQPDPPAAPTGLAATVLSSTSIRLDFTDNSTTETDFRIERAANGGGFSEINVFAQPVPPNTTGARTFTDNSVTADNTYQYRVRAAITTTPSAFSSYTNTVTATTGPVAPTLTGLQGTGSSTVVVTFTDNSRTETGFIIQRSVNGGAFQPVSPNAPPVAGTPNTVTYTDSGAQPELPNTYRVLATNGTGNSAPSNTLSITPLAAPTNVVVTPTSQQSVTVTFKDNSGNETGFKAERSTDGTNWTAVGGTIAALTGTGATGSFSDSGLQAGTTYTYRVWAYSANAQSDRTSGQATTPPNPPALPSNLMVAPGTQTTLNITFTDNSDNETGFVVERSTSANGTFAAISGSPFAAVAGTGTVVSVTDTGLSAGTTYFYRVKAVNSGGDMGYVGPASGTTLPSPPAAPTSVSATLTAATTITLTFTDNANNETGFVVERSTDGGNTFPVTLPTVPAKVPSGTVTVVDGGLAADTSYTYRVHATNTGGDSSTAKSNTALTAPAAPSNLTFTSITNNQVRLFWVNNSSTATSFKVDRSLDGVNFTPLATVSAPTVSYLDTGLSGATTYTYRVRASNGSPVDSDFSTPASATTLPNPAGAPTNLQLTVKSQTQIDVSFVDASANEDGFTVQRSTDGTNWVPVSNNLPPSPGTGLTITVHDSGLTANTAYSYRVQAFNAGGSSAWVTAGPVTTFPVPPASPNNLTVSVVPGSSSQLQLSWKDGSNNETGFLLERATGNSNVFTTVSSGIGASNGVGGTVTFTDTGLTANTRYTYRVSAVNQGGNSQPSATASGLTLPGAPGGVTAAANSASTGIVVQWNAPTGGADSYSVEAKTDQPGDQGYHQVGTGSSTDRSFTFVQLIPNVTFTFRVVAVNASGSSAPSNEASAKIAGGLVSLTVSPTSVKGGKAVTGTVTIVGAAPDGGASIALSSTSTSVTVPKSVVIPAGSNSATFSLTTKKVKKAATATISANYGGTTKSASLKLKK